MVVWRSLKHCVKVLVGRRTLFDEHGLFLRQYLLHVTGFRAIRNITCTGLRSEGPGSQALMVMNAINFPRSFGLTYVHTPFSHIQHADRPIEEWVTAWEGLFNLGAGVPLPNVESFLDIDAFCAMRELIEADVLIMSKSSFCYYAALISKGIKIFEPENLIGNDLLPSWKWRSVSPTDNWIPCAADGSFDHPAFERQLLAMGGKA